MIIVSGTVSIRVINDCISAVDVVSNEKNQHLRLVRQVMKDIHPQENPI